MVCYYKGTKQIMQITELLFFRDSRKQSLRLLKLIVVFQHVSGCKQDAIRQDLHGKTPEKGDKVLRVAGRAIHST